MGSCRGSLLVSDENMLELRVGVLLSLAFLEPYNFKLTNQYLKKKKKSFSEMWDQIWKRSGHWVTPEVLGCKGRC